MLIRIPALVLTSNAQNRTAVVNLIAQISRSCPPSLKMIMADILETQEFQKRVEQEVASQLIPHEAKLLETERRVQILEERVKELERNF